MRERSNRPNKKQPSKRSSNKKATKATQTKKSLITKKVGRKVEGKKTPVKKASVKSNAPTKKATKNPPLRRKKIETQDLDRKYTGRSGKWLIVELVEDCDLKENAEEVVQQVRKLCGDGVEYFLPVYAEYVKDNPVYIVLFEGYVFIRVTESVHEGCFKERTEQILGPLICGGRCQYAKNKDINGFKAELKKRLKAKVPKKGQNVVPKVGDYRNLEGLVLSVDKKNMTAKIEFALSSRVVEVNIRIINLEVVE